MTTIHTVFGQRLTGIDRQTVGIVEQKQSPHYIIYLDQTHSTNVVVIDHLDHRISLSGDALVTRLPDVGLAIKTADCAPILLWDETTGVIAAVHSGWQGTLQDVITPTVQAMIAQGADPLKIQAKIGPCLQRDNFEMGRDVYQQFADHDSGYTKFFTPSPRTNGKYLFDNTALIVHQLTSNGVTQIETDPVCTLAQSDKYYSYRARKTDPAHDVMRNVSVIWMD